MASGPNFGTNSISGLVSQTAPHLLQDGELQEANNVDFSTLGAVKSAKDDLQLVEPAYTPTSGGWGLLGGVSHYFYACNNGVDDVVYDYNTSTGAQAVVGGASFTAWGGGNLSVVQGENEVILSDGTIVCIWDGTTVRYLGGPDATSGPTDTVTVSDAPSYAITAISESGGTVTVTAPGSGLLDGEIVWIDGVAGGYLEINGRLFEVENVVGNDFDLADVDGSDWVAGTPAYTNAKVYPGACGLDGTYTYRVSTEVTIPGGKVIESSATVASTFGLGGGISLADNITLAPTDMVTLFLAEVSTADINAWIDGTFTIGTDLTVSRRIYRNKDGDTGQAYLLEAFSHSDSYNGAGILSMDQTPDSSLGALWLPTTFDAHDAPTALGPLALVSQRLYGASGSKLYFSGLDGYEYFAPTDYFSLEGEIVDIAPAGDYLAIFVENGVYLYDPQNVSFKNLRVRFGVSDPGAVTAFDGRLWFANDLGLYSVDALQFGDLSVDAMMSRPQSAHVRDLWTPSASGGRWFLGSTHDTLYALWYKAADTYKMFAIHAAQGGLWSTRDAPATVAPMMITDKKLNRCVVCDMSGEDDYLVAVGAGTTDLESTIKSKRYVQGHGILRSIMLHIGAGSEWVATVDGPGAYSSDVAFEAGDDDKVAIEQLEELSGNVFELTVVGTGTLYGWKISSDFAQGFF